MASKEACTCLTDVQFHWNFDKGLQVRGLENRLKFANDSPTPSLAIPSQISSLTEYQ